MTTRQPPRTTVSRHTRTTASGRKTTVRRHSRTGVPGDHPQPRPKRPSASRPAPAAKPARNLRSRVGPLAGGAAVLLLAVSTGSTVWIVFGVIAVVFGLLTFLLTGPKRRTGLKPQVSVSLVKCGRCGKRYNNPFRHVCKIGFTAAAARRTAARR